MRIVNKIEAKTPQMPRRKRVAAYARVSMESERLQHSLSAQVSFYSSLIQSNPVWEYVGVYADNGITGTKAKAREEFNRMIADCEAGKIDVILTKSISRFARNTVDLLNTVRRLKELGVSVQFEKERIDSLTEDGELMLTIIAAFAQAESQGASDNANLTVKRKFEAGIPVQDLKYTFGFDTDEGGNTYIVEEQAQTVRLIFDLAQKGVWPSKIRRYLNTHGIKGCSGGEWDDTGVHRVLHNPAYKGSMVLQKTYLDSNRVRHKNKGQKDQWYIADNHPAIVSPEQWDEVQEILLARSESLAPRSPQKPPQLVPAEPSIL